MEALLREGVVRYRPVWDTREAGSQMIFIGRGDQKVGVDG